VAVVRRCRWCGRFVPDSTEPTVRTLQVNERPRRTVSQLLCPEDSAFWTSAGYTEPPDPDLPVEVLS
jgi:hypothetical protein